MAGAQAPPPDRACGLAAGTHARAAGFADPGADPFDGCRVINRFRTKLPSGRIAKYSYVRYFFSNLSADIRRIFIEHCELLGIRVTQSNHRNLTVSHRRSVAILEQLVGGRPEAGGRNTMRAEGLEPPRAFAHRHLKPARLPIPPRPRARAPIVSVRRTAAHRATELVCSATCRCTGRSRPGYAVVYPEPREGGEQDDEGDRRPDHADLGRADADRDDRRLVASSRG